MCTCVQYSFVLLQYNDLMKKKRIVENDKAKILQTIKELDQKKNEALNLAWQKVRSTAGHIFYKYIHQYIYNNILMNTFSLVHLTLGNIKYTETVHISPIYKCTS